MKLSMVAVGLAWIGLSGCASSQKIRLAAEREELKAKQLDALGDRYGAAKAHAAATKQYQKAITRAGHHMASATAYW
jgi:outer membrane murein-binding lipoprotein Lpp